MGSYRVLLKEIAYVKKINKRCGDFVNYIKFAEYPYRTKEAVKLVERFKNYEAFKTVGLYVTHFYCEKKEIPGILDLEDYLPNKLDSYSGADYSKFRQFYEAYHNFLEVMPFIERIEISSKYFLE